MTSEEKLEKYWTSIPIGKAHAVDYAYLMTAWKTGEREVRKILQNLSAWDNGDNLILIRSAKAGGGFYRTALVSDIKQFRSECLNKGKSIFAPVTKMNRVLMKAGERQIHFDIGE